MIGLGDIPTISDPCAILSGTSASEPLWGRIDERAVPMAQQTA